MKNLNINIKAAIIAIVLALIILIPITLENLDETKRGGIIDLSDMFAIIPYFLGLPLTSLVYALPMQISLKNPNLIYILLFANILFIIQWIIWSQLIVLSIKFFKSRK